MRRQSDGKDADGAARAAPADSANGSRIHNSYLLNHTLKSIDTALYKLL